MCVGVCLCVGWMGGVGVSCLWFELLVVIVIVILHCASRDVDMFCINSNYVLYSSPSCFHVRGLRCTTVTLLILSLLCVVCMLLY